MIWGNYIKIKNSDRRKAEFELLFEKNEHEKNILIENQVYDYLLKHSPNFIKKN